MVNQKFVQHSPECYEDTSSAGLTATLPVRALPAGLEVAIAMANMKLVQAARAYPGHDLKAAPRYC